MKLCKKCNQNKLKKDFANCKNRKDGLQAYCKSCQQVYRQENAKVLSIKSKIYNKQNSEMVKQRRADYYKRNRLLILNKNASYYIKNKDRILRNNVIRDKRKRSTDALYKLKQIVRCSIRKAASLYTKKSKRTEQILGCSFLELRAHLESKFLPGMTWNNQGEWHIDHIRPLSSANCEKEILELCHYSNLQPLWASDNLKKGGKYE